MPSNSAHAQLGTLSRIAEMIPKKTNHRQKRCEQDPNHLACINVCRDEQANRQNQLSPE
jgi:hypothetical protein